MLSIWVSLGHFWSLVWAHGGGIGLDRVSGAVWACRGGGLTRPVTLPPTHPDLAEVILTVLARSEWCPLPCLYKTTHPHIADRTDKVPRRNTEVLWRPRFTTHIQKGYTQDLQRKNWLSHQDHTCDYTRTEGRRSSTPRNYNGQVSKAANRSVSNVRLYSYVMVLWYNVLTAGQNIVFSIYTLTCFRFTSTTGRHVRLARSVGAIPAGRGRGRYGPHSGSLAPTMYGPNDHRQNPAVRNGLTRGQGSKERHRPTDPQICK